MNEIAQQIRDAGLIFGYHNHDFEFQKWNGVLAFDRIIEECPDLYFVFDTFWAQAGGANPVTYIRKLKGRIQTIHLKDYRIVNGVRQFAEIGQGNLDWDDILDACHETNIPYAVIEQDDNFLNDPFESLAMSRDFLLEKV
jgi:sugar phosphate isomerase/epimerase